MTDIVLNPPKQARSRERLQRILDTAERVLVEEGADALTTTRIAEVGEIPVGSVYRFFPGKDAIVEAIALRFWGEFAEAFEARADAAERTPEDHPATALVTTVADQFRAAPGFRALWFGGLRTERLRDATRPYRLRFGAAAERIIAARWPASSAEARATAARMVVLTGDALVREAFRIDPAGDEALLAEACFSLDAYLDARVGGAR